MTKDEAMKAAVARVGNRAAELMVQHDDWSVRDCMQVAIMEEAILYGVPGEQAPVGLLSRSPIDPNR